MRIVRFRRHRAPTSYGILESDLQITPVEGDVFGKWKRSHRRVRLETVRLLCPVQPPNILAIALNYRTHVLEAGQEIPTAPALFLKASTAIIGPDQPIVLPAMAPNEVDYEAELVIVVGKLARNVSEANALDYVLGYTCGNDVSARDCQLRLDTHIARAKSFDTFAPVGPWIETDLNPDACSIKCRLSGNTMQNANTMDLVFSARQLVSYLSRCMTLLPGTIVMTGTPAGVGYAHKPPIFLRPGDVVEVDIEGIGVLRNPVVSELTILSEMAS